MPHSFPHRPAAKGLTLKGNDMLLPVMTTKSTLVAAITALSILAVPASPALAWGDKEQGFVAGVATAVVIDELFRHNRKARTVHRAPQVVYVEPQPVYATSIYSTPAAQAFNSYSTSERMAIQRSLRSWGYYNGGIDGTFGPGTYNAIVAYARAEGASANLSSRTGAFAIYDGLIF
jgi:Putative peptidoglycan binding domain